MQILQLLPHTAAVDGIQRATLDFTRGLARFGDQSTVLTLDRGDNFSAWQKATARVVVVPTLSASVRQPHRLIHAALATRGVARGSDVVVSHRLDLLTAGAVVARRERAPLILHAHNAPPPWLSWGDIVRAPGSRLVAQVVVASQYMASVWGPVVPPDIPVSVVEYPIDPQAFPFVSAKERDSAREAVGLTPEALSVGFFGRLEPVKGLHVLAQALNVLARDRGMPVHLIVQGAPGLGTPPSAALEYEARWRQAVDFPVTLLKSNPDIRPTMAACDVIAVPSVWAEPSGLVVSEALSMGLPVVGSRIGGIPEQLPSDSPLVRAVPPEDARALADAIAALLSAPPDHAARQALRDHVRGHRSPESAANSYRQLLLRTASTPPPVRGELRAIA